MPVQQEILDGMAEKFGLNARERRTAEEIIEIISEMAPHTQKAAIQMLDNKINGRDPFANIAVSSNEERFFVEASQAIFDVKEWARASELVMGRPQGSAYHKLKKAFLDLKVADGVSHGSGAEWFPPEVPHILLVEHDWGAAFASSEEFDEGAFRLPFPFCCFEFVLNGKRVVVLAREREGGITMRPFILSKETWVAALQYDLDDGRWTTTGHSFRMTEEVLADLISRQMRAISIVLEAGAFRAEPVSPPEKLNKARVRRGEVPLPTHHVIRISPERSARRQTSGEGHDPKWRVRCHFRRGHWRHYETHKTWVKWMICGNPDLGFVEKQYRV